MKINSTLRDRFNAKVVRSEGCWKWTAKKNNAGYGMIRPTGLASDSFVLASRVSWFLTYGQIPAGMNVLHKCDNPECTNPEHLFVGTHRDNANDKIAKGRAYGPHWVENTRLAAYKRRKLTPEQGSEARKMIANGAALRAVARHFGVSRRGIRSWL